MVPEGLVHLANCMRVLILTVTSDCSYFFESCSVLFQKLPLTLECFYLSLYPRRRGTEGGDTKLRFLLPLLPSGLLLSHFERIMVLLRKNDTRGVSVVEFDGTSDLRKLFLFYEKFYMQLRADVHKDPGLLRNLKETAFDLYYDTFASCEELLEEAKSYAAVKQIEHYCILVPCLT